MNALEHRIPPPIVVLLTGLLMWATARYTSHPSIAAGARLAVAGMGFAVGLLLSGSGLLAFRRSRTTIDPVHLEAASALVTNGIFRFSRNPMYLGFVTILTAWAAYLDAPWTFVGPIAFVLFTQRFQIVPEERVMRAKFGGQYEDYRKRVRRWI